MLSVIEQGEKILALFVFEMNPWDDSRDLTLPGEVSPEITRLCRIGSKVTKQPLYYRHI